MLKKIIHIYNTVIHIYLNINNTTLHNLHKDTCNFCFFQSVSKHNILADALSLSSNTYRRHTYATLKSATFLKIHLEMEWGDL